MKTSGVRIVREDLGLGKLAKFIKDAGSKVVRVGIQGEQADRKYTDGKTTVADAATFNEYGTINIPARSFIRRTAYEDRNAIRRSIRKRFRAELKRSLSFAKASNALHEVGGDVVGMMQAKIDSSKTWAKPNAPSTILKKGSDHPLIETGLLRSSISSKVESK